MSATLEPSALRLAVAALGGLAVGIEREWSASARQRAPKFAGVRTFLLLGLIGGMAGELHVAGQAMAAGVLLVAAGSLVVAAYLVASRGGDPDGTTEVSAIVVLGAGVLAGSGHLVLASAVAALTALVLVEKSRIHSVVQTFDPAMLTAAARFAVLALVVLPLLPEGPFGPAPGLRPRELWGLVLVFSGLSFAGFLALRAVGPQQGYGLAGLLGGLVSSTAVTMSFARESRAEPGLGGALAVGVTAACTVTFARVGLLATALDPRLGTTMAVHMAAPLAVGLVIAAVGFRRAKESAAAAPQPRNPLGLLVAIQMALAFQVVLYVVAWATGRFGSTGLMGTSALLGLTDVDALTFSVAKLGSSTAADVAGKALAVGALANTLFKLAAVVGLGRGAFALEAGASLLALALAAAVAVVFW